MKSKIKYILTAIAVSLSLICNAEEKETIKESINVFMAGDSHVHARFYPERVGEILTEAYPEIIFSHWGKNGAGFYTYNESTEYQNIIFENKPDILIMHLGTNDCYSPKFRTAKLISDMQEFYNIVKTKFPECKIVYITPFDNKLKNRKSGKRKFNPNNKPCAAAIVDFASKHDDAYAVDNHTDFGMVFLNGGSKLIREDFVHLTEEGYQLLGDQVGNAILSIKELWPDSEKEN